MILNKTLFHLQIILSIQRIFFYLIIFKFIIQKQNPTAVIDALNNRKEYEYDAKGNLIKAISPQQTAVSYTYDSSDRLKTITDPEGNTTTYEYAGAGCSSCGGSIDSPTTIKDPLGNITKYIYDKNASLNSVVDPIGSISVFGRNALGRVITATDANGNVTKYQYDALGRMISASNSDSTMTFTYDTLGRVKTFTDGRLNKTITYEYDKNGNRTKMTDPEGGITTYAYNNLNLLTTITDPSGKTFNITYDALYRRTSMKYPNGITANYTYDPAGQIAEIINKLNTTPITKNIYTYDNAGNRLTNTDLTGTHTYQYDSTYQLTSAIHPNNTETFTYDKNGNRITETKGQTTINYTHTAGNRIATRNGETYTYDKNGNIVSVTNAQGTTAYEYDNENRLIKATMPDGTIAVYKYDPFGRRIEKAVTENGTTTTTRYLYDGDNILAEYDENNNIKTQYIQNLGIDDQLAMIKNGQTYYYHKDGLGSITAITDSSGTIVQKYEYDSFGNITSTLNPNFVQPYKFTGREYDSETGMYYYRERNYNQKTGTFIQKDPIEFNGGDMNLYRYVGNNPINIIDPFGLHEVHFIPIYHTLKPTYDHLVITYDDKGIPVNISSGSIKPDPKRDKCKKGCPTIESGTYKFKYDIKKSSNPEYPALRVKGGNFVPTRGPNPNQDYKFKMDGVWIHKGCPDGTCAEGCLTIKPSDWTGFMKNFPEGSSGHVTVFEK